VIGRLQRQIRQMERALEGMPHEEQRRLKQRLTRLSPKQIRFVCDALQCGRDNRRVPAPELDLLENCVETWWAHGSAAKLAVLARIAGLSDSASWLTFWTDGSSARHQQEKFPSECGHWVPQTGGRPASLSA